MFGKTNQGLEQVVKPTVLLYLEDYWRFWRDTPAWAVMEEAVQQLEKYLGISRTRVTLSQKWLENDPSGTGTSIEAYLQDVRPLRPGNPSYRH
jgi:hypothetical protein